MVNNLLYVLVYRFAATELQSNLLVEVMDCEYHLHKVHLLALAAT